MELLNNKPKPHPLHWVVEALMNDPSYLEKVLCECQGCYLFDRLVLAGAAY